MHVLHGIFWIAFIGSTFFAMTDILIRSGAVIFAVLIALMGLVLCTVVFLAFMDMRPTKSKFYIS